jgi:hypothetical protein
VAYGAKALLDSGLPDEVGHLLSSPSWKSVKVILARPTGRHADDPERSGARVWIADTARGVMVQRTLTDLGELAALDPASLAAGHLPAWPGCPEPRLFVCSNGRRDVCCARLGRAALAGVKDDAVWECSHLGGHRFAATGVVLPWGYVYGRLDADSIGTIMTAARAGAISPDGARGRSALSPPGQCADLHLRAAAGLFAPDDVVYRSERRDAQGRVVVTLGTPSSGATEVVVTRHRTEPSPPSCGGVAEQHDEWRVVGIVKP